MIKKYFASGMMILLPMVFTFFILGFLIHLLTIPFLNMMTTWLTTNDLLKQSWLVMHPHLIAITSKILILLFLILFTLCIGFLGKIFLLNSLFRYGNQLFNQLPIVNKIYRFFASIVQCLFSPSSKIFSRVVLAPFPTVYHRTIGFVSGSYVNIEQSRLANKDLVFVFIPSAPNPTGGFIILFEEKDLLPTNMKVDEALQFAVSCGVVIKN